MPAKRPKTSLDVLNSDSRALSVLINDKEVGEIKVKALLTLLITECLDYFSVTNSMSDSQIAITVNFIIDDYVCYKPDFFMLCFDNAKKFRYGKNYNRIDGQIIFEWLQQADEEFTAEIENQRIREHKKVTSTTVNYGDYSTIPEDPKDRPVPMPEYVKEKVFGIGKEKEVKLPAIEDVPIDPAKKLTNSFIEEFHDKKEPDGKFIKIEGKFLDLHEYLNLRINQHNEQEFVRIEKLINDENPIAIRVQNGAKESIYHAELSTGEKIGFYTNYNYSEKENAVDLMDDHCEIFIVR